MDDRHARILGWARRHLRWLICLALVLPAAQIAGAVHLISHLATTQDERGNRDAVDVAQCPICPVAAAVATGGAASAVASVHVADLPVAVLAAAAFVFVFAAPQRRFLSRAPPTLLH